jgi:hypothetical protein
MSDLTLLVSVFLTKPTNNVYRAARTTRQAFVNLLRLSGEYDPPG